MTIQSQFIIPVASLDQFMPMNLVFDNQGRIEHIGPTMAKVLGEDMLGKSFFSLFEMRRPSEIRSLDDVRKFAGNKIYLRLKDTQKTPVIGAVAVLGETRQVLLNLSFGYSVVEAVAQFDLAGSDFAPTDLTVEMLYLVEAKTAAMEATTAQAHRLHGEKTDAQNEAMTDELTKLGNRRALDDWLRHHIRSGTDFSLLQIDLDYFKSVNDTLGHAAGDVVLKEVAQILSSETRESDLVARIGGDEFVVVLSDSTRPEQLQTMASRIIAKLEQPIAFKGETCRISASIGIVCSDIYEEISPGQILEDADDALYQSKRAGRGRYTHFTPEMRTLPEGDAE